ncbi:hypothetical protein ISCGN_029291 [Ixodes scapularis]
MLQSEEAPSAFFFFFLASFQSFLHFHPAEARVCLPTTSGHPVFAACWNVWVYHFLLVPPFLPPRLPKCICCNKVAHGRGKVAFPVFATPLSVLSTAQTSARGAAACYRRRGGNIANKHRTSLEAFNTSPQKSVPGFPPQSHN